MVIQEFWTFVTDVVLALISWTFAWRLALHARKAPSTTLKFWIAVFVTIGLAAIQGAVYHGFKDSLPFVIYYGIRISTLWSLSLTAYVLSMALLSFGLKKDHPLYRALQVLLLVKGLAFVAIAVVKTEFLMAVLDYGTSFLIALAVHTKKIRHPSSPLILAGVLVSIAAALIQTLRISPSETFNHNDLYHAVQVVGLYLFYRGCLRISDAAA
jgi:hypothetical protein